MKPIAVAGHVCLDIIPLFPPRSWVISELMVPGKLIEVGKALISTGGAVSNTGLALHRLGSPVRLIGKTGDDLFADSIASLFEAHGAGLSKGLVRNLSVPTSYTVVVNPPGIDRIFFHCPGANDAFGPEDVLLQSIQGCSIFHFGYPTLMKRMFEGEGVELEAVLQQVKDQGLVTSLDMSLPDPSSPAGKAPWRQILRRCLPLVDMYVPSIEEVLAMLRPGATFDYDRATLRQTTGELLDMGAGLAMIKLGANGIYLRTSSNRRRLEFLEKLGCRVDEWADQEHLVPTFEVDVAGTTGCGDSAIAGFLMAVSQGHSPLESLDIATATGACRAESRDAVSGIPCLSELKQRLAKGWPRLQSNV